MHKYAAGDDLLELARNEVTQAWTLLNELADQNGSCHSSTRLVLVSDRFLV
jgi:hypothetical protein